MKIKAIEFIRGALGMTANVTLIKDNEIIYQGLRSMIPFQQIADCEVESVARPGAEGDIIVSLSTSKSTTYRITYTLNGNARFNIVTTPYGINAACAVVSSVPGVSVISASDIYTGETWLNFSGELVKQ